MASTASWSTPGDTRALAAALHRAVDPQKGCLVATLEVPEEKIIMGWWLARMPPG